MYKKLHLYFGLNMDLTSFVNALICSLRAIFLYSKDKIQLQTPGGNATDDVQEAFATIPEF